MQKIVSLNLNGIRAAWRKNLAAWIYNQQNLPDVICFQEIKAQIPDLSDEMINPKNYHAYYFAAEKKGYSGVGLWCKNKPSNIQCGFNLPEFSEFDQQGRFLRADFDEQNLSVISLYLPSGSANEERQQSKFRFLDAFFPYLQNLFAEYQNDNNKKIIVCGDFNIAHQNIDLKNWKGNLKNSGFLPEEREWISKVFVENFWVDVYRNLYPTAESECYTWWSNRGQAWAKNVGWRIDYQIATPNVAKTAKSAFVYKEERFSDHAPLIIEYDF